MLAQRMLVQRKSGINPGIDQNAEPATTARKRLCPRLAAYVRAPLLAIFLVVVAVATFDQPACAQDAAANYTVVAGDTLGAIAARLGVSLDALVAANSLTDPDQLAVGQVLIIPGATGALPAIASAATIETDVARAAPGDAVATLAARLAQDASLIATLNGVDATARLFPGQPVKVPVGAGLTETRPYGAITGVEPSAALMQGHTGRVYVTTTRPVSLSAGFLGQPLVFTPVISDGLRQFAFLPVPALQEVGVYTLEVGYTTRRGIPVARRWPVEIQDGQYESQEINVPQETADQLTPEVVQAELAKVTAIWSQISPDLWWRDRFVRPADPQYATTSPFGTRRTYSIAEIGKFHAGQDFGAPEGALVTAPAPGVVVLAEPLMVRGNAVILDHGRGVFTGYWHLSEIKVAPGQVVNAGDVLGLIGNTGLSTGAHLHWELRIDGVAVDPMQFLEEGPWE